MKLETFFEKFDQFVEAPDAVGKLRELILRLAMQGKLVRQDPEEGDAGALLAQIAAHRKGNSAHKSDNGESIELESEKTWHDVPTSWRWVRLGTVGDIVGGGTPRSDNSSYFAEEGIPWLTPADLNGYTQKRIARGRRFITKLGLENSSAQLLPEGSVLFSSRAPIGYVAIAGVPLATNQGFKSCVPFVRETNEFLYYFLMSAAARIDREASGTTFREVSGKIVSQIPVPLPPLAEQKRIVAKVDELMALCKQLEARQLERETRHAALAHASLARFADAPTPANLNLIFHKSYTIPPADLRKSILTLAVQGKLVPQDPNDEPAQALVATIETEKARRIRDGTLRNLKPAAPITDEDKKFELPFNWEWVRLGQVVKLWNGFAFKSGDFQPNGIPVIRIGDLQDGLVDANTAVCVSEDIAKTVGQEFWIPEDALLIAMSGATTGKVAFNRTGQRLLLNQRVGRLEPLLVSSDYVRFFFETIVARNLSISFGSAIPNLSADQINGTVLPLPPLAEQRRIVAKVDQLMASVDQLETQLAASRATGLNLMDAIMSELAAAA
jgi:type I restriction enzyme S subunit